MSPGMNNFLRVNFATIKDYAKDLSELDIYESKKKLELMKNQIEICQKIMEDL